VSAFGTPLLQKAAGKLQLANQHLAEAKHVLEVEKQQTESLLDRQVRL